MGVGVIIRDEKGSLIVALSKPFTVLHKPASAEVVAALSAVKFYREWEYMIFSSKGIRHS
jgi:hypothetical protein